MTLAVHVSSQLDALTNTMDIMEQKNVLTYAQRNFSQAK